LNHIPIPYVNSLSVKLIDGKQPNNNTDGQYWLEDGSLK
jgi:hypothetical protein